MKSNLEIAQEADLQPIDDIASSLGLLSEEVEPYGRYKAKVSLSALERLADRPQGKIICVAGVTPTKAGEGKTTTAVGLTQGLGHIGKNPVLCLREPSLGPVFGMKGGAAGGGYTQVVPMEDLNLHFTGDIHAISAANNLLAAMLDASILHGNVHKIDALQVSWRRAVDINDRALRQITIAQGGRANGYPRETGFDITAASEVMAITAVARDLQDLRRRLGAITVANSFDGGRPVTAEDLGAAGAMAVLLKDAIKPNLIQTLEGQPCLMHCGPFANIAHGNSSLIADLMGMRLGDYVITESGFGSDMGMEKFFDIVCRVGDSCPAPSWSCARSARSSTTRGSRTPTPTGRSPAPLWRPARTTCAGTSRSSRSSACRAWWRSTGARATRTRRSRSRAGWRWTSAPTGPRSTRGSSAAAKAPPTCARAVVEAAEKPSNFGLIYRDEDPIIDKISAVARRVVRRLRRLPLSRG